jgi:hypothetical protein
LFHNPQVSRSILLPEDGLLGGGEERGMGKGEVFLCVHTYPVINSFVNCSCYPREFLNKAAMDDWILWKLFSARSGCSFVGVEIFSRTSLPVLTFYLV